jgi:hypothetical protein
MFVYTVSQYFTIEVIVMDDKWFITMKTRKHVIDIVLVLVHSYSIDYSID